ncbi:hypothetical protein C2W64_04566 [Brevibacillus laterosporus]|nr:hypothetical protein C2W64_04566 [Brevibacillus laterosporus]
MQLFNKPITCDKGGCGMNLNEGDKVQGEGIGSIHPVRQI